MKLQLVWLLYCCIQIVSTLKGLPTSSTSNFKMIDNTLGKTSQGNLQYLHTNVDQNVQEATAQKAVKRLLGDRHSEILIRVDPSLTGSIFQDGFSVTYIDKNNTVVITGTTGVTALYGLNDYLKYHCQAHISWEGNQLNLPYPLPSVTYNRQVLDRFRYYQNVCTDSYSFVWWDWPRWKKEIDWMALNGINMPLAFTGQEAIWQRVYLKLGLTAQDVSEYISGPGFLAWWRMGNINRWGGPIPQPFVEKKLALLHKILKRMRNFGMLPVLPSFAGNVPSALRKIYPNVTLLQHPSWNHFNSTYATFMLEPTNPLFHEIGSVFMEELIKEVGTNHIYSCDTFNENDPKESSPEFLKASAKATYDAMGSTDPKAVWMMQSWVFKSEFWQQEQVEAYLSGVERGNALVLDLEAELNPQYKKYLFFGHSFIWCMLQNFGGTMNLYGVLDLVNNGISNTRENVTSGEFVGIGSCPEGINQNSVMFDFLYEMSLHSKSVDMSLWIASYAKRRYGMTNTLIQETWEILQEKMYNAPHEISNHGKSVITRRPSLKISNPIWYELDDIRKVVYWFLKASTETSSNLTNSSLYRHDVVDFTRQFLEILGAEIYKTLIESYDSKKVEKFEQSSVQLVDVLDDLELLLKTQEKFLLGPWVTMAESWAETVQETKLLRYNALNQITLWGPTGEIVDYAAKSWAGAVGSYYKPRWTSFIAALNSSLVTGKPFSSKAFRRDVLQNVEIPFTLSSENFPVVPEGDSIIEATRIYQKWIKTFRRFVRKQRKTIHKTTPKTEQ